MSMNRPLLSIVTVCKNALPYLKPTIESVLTQDCDSFEYVVIDGASNDGTTEYLEQIDSDTLKWISEPDSGIAEAMNKGTDLASGEWVAHLHAGDSALPGAFELVTQTVHDTHVDVICGAMIKAEGHREVLYLSAPDRLPLDMTVHHPAIWTRRATFKKHGGFEPSFPNAMDYELFLRLYIQGHLFQALDAPLARMAAGGVSERSLWRTQKEAWLIRQSLLTSGFSRTYPYFLYVVFRTSCRRGLQRVGLGGFVSWYRKRFAIAPKDTAQNR
jgi:glycosyltransferase involved in cell wall biosynthesis